MSADIEPKAGTARTASTDTSESQQLSRVLEAVLLACDKSLSHARIAEAIGVDSESAHDVIASLIQGLNESYERESRAFRIERLSGGYRLMTLPEFSWAVAAIRGMQPSSKLTKASIETLSIIAYKQPITRAEIDAIRGVASGELVKGLLDKQLVAITGRAETLGRPMLYGTTKRFLEAFGLPSLRDLPPVDDGFEAVLASRNVDATQAEATDESSASSSEQHNTRDAGELDSADPNQDTVKSGDEPDA